MKKMLLLADSIMLHYKKYLTQFLKNEFEIFTKQGMQDAEKNLNIPAGANAGDSAMLRDYLECMNRRGELFYYCAVFNCGLHDIKSDAATGINQVPIDEYKNNLRKILDIFEKNALKTIFINSTPVIDKIHNSPENLALNKIKRHREDLLKYNAAAQAIMKERAVCVIDLFSFTDKFKDRAFCDHAHFKPRIRKLQAAYICGALKAIIT